MSFSGPRSALSYLQTTCAESCQRAVLAPLGEICGGNQVRRCKRWFLQTFLFFSRLTLASLGCGLYNCAYCCPRLPLKWVLAKQEALGGSNEQVHKLASQLFRIRLFLIGACCTYFSITPTSNLLYMMSNLKVLGQAIDGKNTHPSFVLLTLSVDFSRRLTSLISVYLHISLFALGPPGVCHHCSECRGRAGGSRTFGQTCPQLLARWVSNSLFDYTAGCELDTSTERMCRHVTCGGCWGCNYMNEAVVYIWHGSHWLWV